MIQTIYDEILDRDRENLSHLSRYTKTYFMSGENTWGAFNNLSNGFGALKDLRDLSMLQAK